MVLERKRQIYIDIHYTFGSNNEVQTRIQHSNSNLCDLVGHYRLCLLYILVFIEHETRSTILGAPPFIIQNKSFQFQHSISNQFHFSYSTFLIETKLSQILIPACWHYNSLPKESSDNKCDRTEEMKNTHKY